MGISICHRYRPFSHQPGVILLLPGSSWKVVAYPARLDLSNLDPNHPATLRLLLRIRGPVEGFTAMQDLERCWIRIFGRTAEGYLSYRLSASDRGITLLVERVWPEGIAFIHSNRVERCKRGEGIEFSLPTLFSPPLDVRKRERMHFGCSKKQDWTLVGRRLSCREILPIWFHLGTSTPRQCSIELGTFHLLEECREGLRKGDRVEIGPALMRLFRAGFEGILSPRLRDTEYQALLSEEEVIPSSASPLALLHRSVELIRSLFLERTDWGISLLPCLPKEIHAGRFIGARPLPTLALDLEWSKKRIRRVLLYPSADQQLLLGLPGAVRSFRFTPNGGRGDSFQVGRELFLEKGRSYLLDRFAR